MSSKKSAIIHEHTAHLIGNVVSFLELLKADDCDEPHPKVSKQTASKILKEWSSSISANKSHDKYIISNKVKYAKLLKSIADFLD